jgi:hypothetical protein
MPLYGVVLVLPDSIEIKLDELRHGYTQKMNYIKIPHISLFPFSAEANIKRYWKANYLRMLLAPHLLR